MSYSYTTSASFTRTHAKHLAAKVVSDLYQCHVLYGQPGADSISAYQDELIELLANEYIDSYEFGFKKDGYRIVSWRYTVGADGGLQGDSNAGNLVARVDVTGATYYNHLIKSGKFFLLTSAEQAGVESSLPITRTPQSLPGDGNGYWQSDHGYSAGGVRVERKTYRPW